MTTTAKRLWIIWGSSHLLFLVLALLALPATSHATQSAPAQRSFQSPEEARQALIAAVQAKDHRQLAAIFGPALQDLEPGDPVEQAAEFDHFAHEVGEAVAID